MRYAQIREMDISNGEGVGVSLFVQGCHHHCKGCFNPETWDFKGGKEWTEELEFEFLDLIDRPYIKRVTILGGEPLAEENLKDILTLIEHIRTCFEGTKSIWLYTGYTWDILHSYSRGFDENSQKWNNNTDLRLKILDLCDVLIEGPFEEGKKDISLKFRGSSNQRIIDVKNSIKESKVVLYDI